MIQVSSRMIGLRLRQGPRWRPYQGRNPPGNCGLEGNDKQTRSLSTSIQNAYTCEILDNDQERLHSLSCLETETSMINDRWPWRVEQDVELCSESISMSVEDTEHTEKIWGNVEGGLTMVLGY